MSLATEYRRQFGWRDWPRVLLGFSLVASSLEAQRQPGAPVVALPAPVLTIGTEGDPDYEFVSIIAAFRLPNGAIAVADRQAPTIRVFDAQGRLSGKLGRSGEGPGEFRNIRELFVTGDTITAYDSNLLRLTRYLASGTLLGTQPVRIASQEGRVHISGRLANGRWLVTTPHSPGWHNGPGVYRDTLRVGSVSPSSTGAVGWIGGFPGASLFSFMPGQDQSRWAAGWLFFAPTTVVRTIADTIIVGDTGLLELQYYLADGKPVRRVSLPLEAAPDLSRHRAAARDEELAQSGARTNREYVQAMYDVPRPAPRYLDFLVAGDGRLWVRLFEERPGGPVPYLVVSSAGALQTRLSLPAKSRLVRVQPPWLLVVLRDANDVERLGLVRWTPN